MPELIILVAGLTIAAAFVLRPLWRTDPDQGPSDDRDAASIGHRVALESLRDVQADHRAGLLDERAYAAQVAEAEADAARTGAALDAVPDTAPAAPGGRGGRRAGLVAASVIGLLLIGGWMVEATGLANATVINQGLADARAAEEARQASIDELLAAIAADPTDSVALSNLADAYLGGSTIDDLARAAAALQVLLDVEPERADAYERLMSAYLRAGDDVNARAVHDSYAERSSADPVEIAFFDGLIALRGEDDPGRAVAAFDTFLELAPDDPRAGMIRGLRDEAANASP